MATPEQRRLEPKEIRRFGSGRESFVTPDLTKIQTVSYSAFLQDDVPSDKRKDQGLESVLREIFPIESYDKQISLEYLSYDLGKPRYTPDECRQLRLTYGRPFRVLLRLNKEEPYEEEVYLGDLPIMLGGGEFIINGAERVVVSQLHRSPGVDFVLEQDGTSDRKLPSCRIIPGTGQLDRNQCHQEGRAERPDRPERQVLGDHAAAGHESEYSTDADILRAFYATPTEKIVDGRSVVEDRRQSGGRRHRLPDVERSGRRDHRRSGPQDHQERGRDDLHVRRQQGRGHGRLPSRSLIFNSLADDATSSHEEALLRIYQRLRPGNPPQLEKAKTLFDEKFYDVNRYRLGRVGRFRINRKLKLDVSEKEMTLRPEDLIAAIAYLLKLTEGADDAEIDDIDHLGNRRLRTIDELASDELRKGFLKLRRTVQERMSLKDAADMTPRSLINPKSISAAIEYFFGRGELSQVVDQTNPLSQLTHERRLSALGPGGLNRKRAGFEVRDVHISHYGRICPIETPEGTNIGLISSLAIYAGVDDYGFLVTPYRLVKKGKLTDEIVWLRADEEAEAHVAPADTQVVDGKLQAGPNMIARYRADFRIVAPEEVDYIDVAPSQMVGVSAGLIPFLEHDDANRALMGSNMQRQAVPLLITEPPIVATGMEKDVAVNSSMVVRARRAGKVTYCDASRIEVGSDIYELKKFVGLNERTCLNQKPIIQLGDKVEKGQVHRRRSRHLSGRTGAGTQRAGRLHVVRRLQL